MAAEEEQQQEQRGQVGRQAGRLLPAGSPSISSARPALPASQPLFPPFRPLPPSWLSAHRPQDLCLTSPLARSLPGKLPLTAAHTRRCGAGGGSPNSQGGKERAGSTPKSAPHFGLVTCCCCSTRKEPVRSADPAPDPWLLSPHPSPSFLRRASPRESESETKTSSPSQPRRERE